MKIVAFDTSTSYAALAFWHKDQCLIDIRFQFGNQHSQFLLAEIEHHRKRLGWQLQEINALVVGLGPGSFTGLRVGLATAQGLSFALSCPLYGVSSLDALAQTAPHGASLLALCTDARKQELYVRLYRRAFCARSAPLSPQDPAHTNVTAGNDALEQTMPPVAISSHLLLTPSSLAQHLCSFQEEVLLLGNGASLYASQIQAQVPQKLWKADPVFDHVWASQLITLALPEIQTGRALAPQQIQPIYIRPSEAEMNIGPPMGGSPLKHRLQEDGSILPDSSDESA